MVQLVPPARPILSTSTETINSVALLASAWESHDNAPVPIGSEIRFALLQFCKPPKLFDILFRLALLSPTHVTTSNSSTQITERLQSKRESFWIKTGVKSFTTALPALTYITGHSLRAIWATRSHLTEVTSGILCVTCLCLAVRVRATQLQTLNSSA
jgi:hypothetical protein